MKRYFRKFLYFCAQRAFFYSGRFFVFRKGQEPRSVIYKPDALGDLILASGIIQKLLQETDDQWVLFCSPTTATLAQTLFPELECVRLDGTNQSDTGSIRKRLRPIKNFLNTYCVDRMICLRHSLTGMDHIMLNWLNPRESAGIIQSPLNPVLPGSIAKVSFTKRVAYPIEREKLPLEVRAHLEVIKALTGKSWRECEVIPFLHESEREPTSLSERTLIVFPTTRQEVRNYPASSLSESINRFCEDHLNYRIIFSGTQDQRSDIEKVQNQLHPKISSEILFPDSILAAIDLIRDGSVILGMESAPTHIATVLNKPTVSILGGGHYNYFAPWGNAERQIWLTHKVPCYQCNWCCHYPVDHCVDSIPVDAIVAALEKMSMLAD